MAERPRRAAELRARHVRAQSLGAVVMVGPFVWQLLTSLKTFAESIARAADVLPEVELEQLRRGLRARCRSAACSSTPCS